MEKTKKGAMQHSKEQPKEPSNQNPAEQKIRSFSKISSLFFHTKTFFSKVEKEKDYFPILLFFVVINAAAVLIQFLFTLPALLDLGSGAIIKQSLSEIYNITLAFATPFILALLIHLGALIFGGRQGFFNTFKPLTYTLVIGIFYSLFYTLLSGIYNLVSPLDPSVMANLQAKMQSGLISLSDLAPLRARLGMMFIIGVIAIIHSLYAGTIGVAKFQNIKKWKAFFSLILFPLIIFILFIGLLYFVFQISAQV